MGDTDAQHNLGLKVLMRIKNNGFGVRYHLYRTFLSDPGLDLRGERLEVVQNSVRFVGAKERKLFFFERAIQIDIESGCDSLLDRRSAYRTLIQNDVVRTNLIPHILALHQFVNTRDVDTGSHAFNECNLCSGVWVGQFLSFNVQNSRKHQDFMIQDRLHRELRPSRSQRDRCGCG